MADRQAHWLDGTPIDDGGAVMARLEDRYRGFVVDGRPVATGVVAVADAWACSNASDRHRVGEVEAGIRGAAYDSPDPDYQLEKALDAATGLDPECTRANLDIKFVLRPPAEVFAAPGLRDKTLRLGGDWRDRPALGPTRQELLSLISAP